MKKMVKCSICERKQSWNFIYFNDNEDNWRICNSCFQEIYGLICKIRHKHNATESFVFGCETTAVYPIKEIWRRFFKDIFKNKINIKNESL